MTYWVHTLSHILDIVIGKPKCAVKLIGAFGFVLKIVIVGTCGYYYAHENITLMERSKLVVTKEDLITLKNFEKNTAVTEASRKGRANTKTKIYKLTNVTVFVAFFREVPWVVKMQYCESNSRKVKLLIF